MNIDINRNSPKPMFYQIQKQLREKIMNEELKEGEQLPSERELSKKLNVTRTTVRKAINSLVTGGYCEKKPGKGIFVSSGKIQLNIQGFKGFTNFIRDKGYEPSTKVIEKKLFFPNEFVAQKLKIDMQSKVLMLKRLRLINEEPGIIENTYLPVDRMPGIDQYEFNRSLYDILEEDFNIYPEYASGIFNLSIIDEDNAHLLNISLNSSVIKKEVVVNDNENNPIEYVETIYRSDKFEFFVEAKRIK